jgi:hypothetical protein
MYTSIDFTSQIVGRRGVPCPTNKGVSYTNLVWLGRDLKNRLLLLLLYSDQTIVQSKVCVLPGQAWCGRECLPH